MSQPSSPPAPVVQSDAAVTLDRDGVRRLGLVALATDLTSERDAAKLLPPGEVVLHVCRVAYENPTTPENLQRMAPRLTDAASLLVPGTPLSAIYYSCTSGSVQIGEAAIDRAIGAARPGVPVVTPTRAATQGFAALGVRRIALVTPYTVETTRPMAAYFSECGLEIVSALCMGLEDDRDMARVSAATIAAAAGEADRPEVEAIFLSCTALPALGAIAGIEAALGKPVVSSNQAAFWAMRHHVALTADPGGMGRLFAHAPDLPVDAMA